MAVITKPVTYAEWLRMPDVSDGIEEVVNGEIRVMPPNKLPHAYAVQRLFRMLDRRLNSDRVELLMANFGLVIRRDPLTSRVPDLAIFDRATAVEIDGYFHSAPQLAVEVGQEKLSDYAEIGTPEVWMLSPEAKTIEVLELAGGSFESVRVVNKGTLAPRVFPEAVIDVESVWRR